MKPTDVTCAIILCKDKVLVVQRSDSMSHPLKWEFPGGKIEKGESEMECIHREIFEELNIKIKIIDRLTPVKHKYGAKCINLIPYIAIYEQGKIVLFEHRQYLLLDPAELISLDWAEADIPILQEYLRL